ncbi:MAG: DJ-1/PfpI family protein [Cyanobacteria bacterium J06648_16]
MAHSNHAESNGAAKKVAILIENRFSDLAVKILRTALQQANAAVTIVGSRMNEEYQSAQGTLLIRPDATATEVSAEDFDALVITGGSIRTNPNVVRLVTDAVIHNKWIAAVGDGPQVLIEANELAGKNVTGARAIRKDLENARANYLDAPTIVDGHMITARRPGDLPIFAAMLLRSLGLNVDFPDTTDPNHEWWVLGEAWGGSSRKEIVQALNMAIVGERYTLEEFKHYLYRVTNRDFHLLLEELCDVKRSHVKRLENRLRSAFETEVSWQARGSEAYATLQSWLQASDEIAILRRVLGDLQTGVVDAYRLCHQLSDPLTADILDIVEHDLSEYEQRLAAIYRARLKAHLQPPLPTTVPAVH